MSYASEQTRERVLICARQEFMEYGFAKANLRRIAENAKATTGALYAHFKNKEELFEALVRHPAEELLLRFKEMHLQVKPVKDESVYQQTESQSSDSTDWMIDYIYDHLNAFKLIICCSEGTHYSGYIDQLIEI